jgi:hypothetical protein
MTIQQTIDIPLDRKIHLDLTLPESVPFGKSELVLEFKSAEPEKPRWTPEPPLPRVHTLEEAIAQAEAQAARRRADPSIPLFNGMWGCLKDSKAFDGDPVAIQREMRDEWPD